MKFWQKIYVYSFLVFFIIFNAASILVIERSHNKMLEQEINNALSQNMSIHSSIDAIVPVLRIYDSIDYEETVLTNIATEFVEKNDEQGIYLTIINEANETIFSNANFKMPPNRQELDKLVMDEIAYVLRDIDERTIVFTSNMIDVQHKKYIFTYMKDVTSIYKDRIDQYSFFVKVDIAASLFYMVLMFIVSKGLTKPMDRLNQTAQVIAQGDFSERVTLKSNDEIGILARNFNHMASVVEETIHDLERNNHEKERFINNFTHELKTPLTSIIGFSSFLRATKYNEEQFLDGLNVIYTEGKRLESLSLKLMDLILLQENHYKMEMHDLGAIIAEMQPALELKAKKKNIAITTEYEEGNLLLEEDLIKVLLFNLIDNALKASDENQPITIRAYWRDNRYILEVIDQGIGIAKEHLDKIFEPFYMADKARTKKNNGAGLGLSICQSVASIHHAVLEVSSVENEGTTVKVTFDQPDPKGVMHQ